MNSFIEPVIADVKSGNKTARAYVEEALDRLGEVNPVYNVTISDTAERALARADSIDQSAAKGEELGRLAGVPFIVKDNFLTLGGKTTAASTMLKDFVAPYQATAIEKLEAEGAIVVAKANLDAFGHGGSTEHSDFGPTKNPYDTERVTGGSSGGSAAAIALEIVPFTLGTDTGGSVRQPASFCGAVGLKPTYGTVSRYGIIAMASSTDTVAPMAKTVHDIGLVLDVMSGRDTKDGTTIQPVTSTYTPQKVQKSLKVGLIKEYMTDAVDAAVREKIHHAVTILRAQGHTVEEISIPSLPLSLAVYYIVVPAEISSNLARYDGIKYGHTAENAKTLEEVYGLSRDQGFNTENKRRILIGSYVLSSGYYDAYYRKAQTVRTMIINDLHKAFEKYDILLGPVAPTPAFKLGERAKDPVQMYLADIMTVAASLAGIPAISVPVGEHNGLPIGAQLMAPSTADQLLLSIAAELEGGE